MSPAAPTLASSDPHATSAPPAREDCAACGPDTRPDACLTPLQHAACPGPVAGVEVTIYEPGDDEGEDTDVRITCGCADPETHGHTGLYGPVIRASGPAGAGEDEPGQR